MSTLRNIKPPLNGLNRTIVECQRCRRLRNFCDRVAKEKRRAFIDWTYWGKPLPGFGDPRAEVLIVGLAPAAHGGTRTGRMFCGDSSGDWLVKALFQTGFANQPTSTYKDDGLELNRVYLTAVVRCAPPLNKPESREIQNCLPYLAEELKILKNLQVVLTLGRIAFDGFLNVARNWYGLRITPRPRFRHGAAYELGSDLPRLRASYHPSRQNTQTGKLTWPMWLRTFRIIQSELSDC
ncbi:MAG: uracil-DNA glycosylase [Thaumarchaeota archaeon]|nr:uracil-DNA glycosylase [Nitrososphaerota archaeon]